MSDFSLTHTRHQEYSYRLPTPPRIVVPPPTLTYEPPELHVPGQRDPGEEVDMSFLWEFNLDSIVQKNTLLDWNYENRRHAQMILPWLYLGPLSAAKDREFLMREGITMVFAIRPSVNGMNGVLKSARETCQEVTAMEAPNFASLTGKLADATRIINAHVAKVRKHAQAIGSTQVGKVLVFCESGNDKSATVVAAYLMDTFDEFNHIKSMQVCQAQRFCVNFDDTVKNCLRSHWDILQARRTVSRARAESTQMHPALFPSKPKRSIEQTRDGEDADMADSMDPSDFLRFAGRDVTPFVNPE